MGLALEFSVGSFTQNKNKRKNVLCHNPTKNPTAKNSPSNSYFFTKRKTPKKNGPLMHHQINFHTHTVSSGWKTFLRLTLSAKMRFPQERNPTNFSKNHTYMLPRQTDNIVNDRGDTPGKFLKYVCMVFRKVIPVQKTIWTFFFEF